MTYGIPKSTLSDHIHSVSSKGYGGDSTVLTHKEEREIFVMCQELAEMRFPLTKAYNVEVVLRDYLRSEGHSSVLGASGLPDRSWWDGSSSRWPTLVQRKHHHLS